MRTDSVGVRTAAPPPPQQATAAQPIATAYVLPYPACAHSEDLVMLANERHVQLRIHNIAEESRPPWLRGTPSIVLGKLMYCGDAAFEWVRISSQNGTGQQQRDSQPVAAAAAAAAATPPSNQIQAVLSMDGKEKGAALGAAAPDYSHIDASDQQYTVNANKALEDMLAARPDLRGNHKRT